MHYKCGEWYEEPVRKAPGNFDQQNERNQPAVQRRKTFEETGSIMDSKSSVRHHSGLSNRQHRLLSEVFLAIQERRLAIVYKILHPRKNAMQLILTKVLHLHIYKIRLTQLVTPTDR